MRIQPNQLVALGHGVWVRSDEVVAIEPIRDQRGPGRRSRVWVRGLGEPFLASRSDEVILRDLTQPRDFVERERRLEAALDAVAAAMERIPPVLLRVLQQETGQDLKTVANDARQALIRDPLSDSGTTRGRTRSGDGQVRLPEAADASEG